MPVARDPIINAAHIQEDAHYEGKQSLAPSVICETLHIIHDEANAALDAFHIDPMEKALWRIAEMAWDVLPLAWKLVPQCDREDTEKSIKEELARRAQKRARNKMD